MPTQPMYRRPVLDPLGLVAGLCDALGLGDVLHPATPHHPAMRDLPVADAVTAMGRNGLGCITHALSLVPRFCHQYAPLSPHCAPRRSRTTP